MQQTVIRIQELIRDSFQWYKKYFQTLIVIAIIASVPFLVLDLGFFFKVVSVDQYNQWSFYGSVVSLGLSVWGAGAYYYFLHNRETNPSLQKVWTSGWSFWLKMLLTSVMVAIIVFAGLVLFIVPGIVALIWFIFSQTVVVTEQTFGWNALKRSIFYVRGYFWDVFGRLIVLGLVSLVIGAVSLYSGLLGTVLQLLFGPFMVMYIYRMYESVRTMKTTTTELPKALDVKT